MNFLPTRPIPEITRELIDAFQRLYAPHTYLARCYRYFRMMPARRPRPNPPWTGPERRLVARICWRQGVWRHTRWRFWWQLLAIALTRPRLLHEYLLTISMGESLFQLRDWVKKDLERRLAMFQAHPALPTMASPASTTPMEPQASQPSTVA
jgi:hypothetical protein